MELRIRVSVSKPRKIFHSLKSSYFCILLQITIMEVIAVMVTVMASVSGRETFSYHTYTKLSLCLTFLLIRTRATSFDFQLQGIDM